MQRRRVLHVVAYVPLVVLALSAIVTMMQIGCSGGSGGGYGYGTSGSSGYGSPGYGSSGTTSPFSP